MNKLEEDIRSLGGIASTGELLRLGHAADAIRLSADYGRTVVKIRKGWFAVHGIPFASFLAWRVGGVLACASAAAYYGLIESDGGVLHVSLHREASRLRTRRSQRERLAKHPDPDVVLHWSRERHQQSRLAVSPATAMEQMRTCERAPDHASMHGTPRNRYP